VITDANSNPLNVDSYDAWGNHDTSNQHATPNDQGYAGHVDDAELGLVYMNARYYDPRLGRFASADTLVPDFGAPQTLNRYAYVNNSPVNAVDPSGHDPWFLEDSTGGGSSWGGSSWDPAPARTGLAYPLPTPANGGRGLVFDDQAFLAKTLSATTSSILADVAAQPDAGSSSGGPWTGGIDLGFSLSSPLFANTTLVFGTGIVFDGTRTGSYLTFGAQGGSICLTLFCGSAGLTLNSYNLTIEGTSEYFYQATGARSTAGGGVVAAQVYMSPDTKAVVGGGVSVGPSFGRSIPAPGQVSAAVGTTYTWLRIQNNVDIGPIGNPMGDPTGGR
jgi:RHS repeat-associated protein